jgi:hypothetical protein
MLDEYARMLAEARQQKAKELAAQETPQDAEEVGSPRTEMS